MYKLSTTVLIALAVATHATNELAYPGSNHKVPYPGINSYDLDQWRCSPHDSPPAAPTLSWFALQVETNGDVSVIKVDDPSEYSSTPHSADTCSSLDNLKYRVPNSTYAVDIASVGPYVLSLKSFKNENDDGLINRNELEKRADLAPRDNCVTNYAVAGAYAWAWATATATAWCTAWATATCTAVAVGVNGPVTAWATASFEASASGFGTASASFYAWDIETATAIACPPAGTCTSAAPPTTTAHPTTPISTTHPISSIIPVSSTTPKPISTTSSITKPTLSLITANHTLSPVTTELIRRSVEDNSYYLDEATTIRNKMIGSAVGGYILGALSTIMLLGLLKCLGRDGKVQLATEEEEGKY